MEPYGQQVSSFKRPLASPSLRARVQPNRSGTHSLPASQWPFLAAKRDSNSKQCKDHCTKLSAQLDLRLGH